MQRHTTSFGWGHRRNGKTKGGRKVTEAKAGVEKKWLLPDKWEGPFCPRCDKGMLNKHMRVRGKSISETRPIYECVEACGFAAYCDDVNLGWKKKALDFFAINKEFSAR
jgi:thiol-disulfide isomerase/thioredoxin